MKIVLRPYEAADTPAIIGLFYDTVHEVNSKDYQPTQLDAWAPAQPDFNRWQTRLKNSKTIVAVLDGQILGFATIEKDLSAIGMVYVHKDYQRKKVGTSLLDALEKKLTKKEVAIASAEVSITAKPFFVRRGYHVVRENRKLLNGIEFLNYEMEKNLSIDNETSEPVAMKDKEEKSGKEKKKDKSFRWRDLFINKVFDLMIVIAGVTIAFQLNNLKLDSDQKSMERFYLESMMSDLKKDLKEADNILTDLKADQAHIQNYLKNAQQSELPADSLGPVLFNVVSLETFRTNQITYQTLVSANGLASFSDRDIRHEITEYYNNYETIHRFESVYTDVLFRLFSYFTPYVDFGGMKILDSQVVKTPQTRNFLIIANSQLTDGIEAYTEMTQKGSKLIKRIESQLK